MFRVLQPSYPSILSPQAPGLVAMFTMDSISGATLVDDGPNGYDGAITGAVAASGHVGDALDFTAASSDYVTITNVATHFAANDPFTISHFFYAGDVTTQQEMVELATRPNSPTADQDGFRTLLSGGNVYIQCLKDGASTLASQAVSINTWYHVGATFDGTTTSLYLNASAPATAACTYNSSAFGVLGAQYNLTTGPYDKFFDGLLDQIRVFDRALTADEIATLANE